MKTDIKPAHHERNDERSPKLKEFLGDMPRDIQYVGIALLIIIVISLILVIVFLPYPYSDGQTILQRLLT